MITRSGYGEVTEALRDGQWVFLCPNCSRPRTKTDDPEVPALVMNDDGWVCPVCGKVVSDQQLWGE